jgi:hypothetical protein
MKSVSRLFAALAILATIAPIGTGGYRLPAKALLRLDQCAWGVVVDDTLYLSPDRLPDAKYIGVLNSTVHFGWDNYLVPDQKGDRIVRAKDWGPKVAWTLQVLEADTRPVAERDLPPGEKSIELGPGGRGGVYHFGDKLPLRSVAVLAVADGPRRGWFLGLTPVRRKLNDQEVTLYRPVLVQNRADAAKLIETWSYGTPRK